MKKFIFFWIVFSSCSNSTSDYKNVTSNIEDINFYELIDVVNYDDVTKINLSIPKFLNQVTPPDEKTIFQYTYFEDKSGYMVSMGKLVTRNTQKLSDKEYIDLTNKWYKTDLNSDLSEIEKILPPSMKNVKVVQFEGNLIINDKYFLKRVSYYNDQSLAGTILEDVNCTEFHFVTIQNKKKYSLNIVYWGDDKDVSSLIGLFNTIGGSVKFN
jgi:hypothetical protein|tara:strand:- start:625 stop:1260 length:636 start_codon:yes stop_codon:yes gene_type:complete